MIIHGIVGNIDLPNSMDYDMFSCSTNRKQTTYKVFRDKLWKNNIRFYFLDSDLKINQNVSQIIRTRKYLFVALQTKVHIYSGDNLNLLSGFQLSDDSKISAILSLFDCIILITNINNYKYLKIIKFNNGFKSNDFNCVLNLRISNSTSNYLYINNRSVVLKLTNGITFKYDIDL